MDPGRTPTFELRFRLTGGEWLHWQRCSLFACLRFCVMMWYDTVKMMLEVECMLIRNAVLDGYPGPVDLRMMHGAVQEIGVGLQKGLYESELDLQGDRLTACTADAPLPERIRRRIRNMPLSSHVRPGTPSPLVRWRDGEIIGVLDEHAAD